MTTDHGRTRDRLARIVESAIRPAMVVDTAPVTIEQWCVPDEPVPFRVAVAQRFAPFRVDDRWGRPWSTRWLRVRGVVPDEWPSDERHGAELIADLGFQSLSPGFQAEGLVFRPDGTIVKGISPRNAHVPLDGGAFTLYLELAANPGIHPEAHWRPTTLGARETAGDEELYRLERLEIALEDREVWHLLQDITVLQGLAEQLPAALPRTAQLWGALARMLDVLDPDDIRSTVKTARAALAPALAARAADSAHTVIATGHAHIDSAWLWPIRETVRKCARTFSNVLSLLDEHPDLRFACSSAQQLAWVKDAYPDLFERIRQKVKTGQFVLVGGQWVEPDTNMPAGEATVRQLVMGKRFFLDEFDVETTEVWLPDTFGYSPALPQIIRLSGSEWFMTQKLSWNQTNRMPHHTFWWEGIDGTRVFTHCPPIETYNAELSPAELAHAQTTFLDHGSGTVSLAPFGWGDGGGGPTREMVAAAHRQADLDGSPRVEIASPREFYERARAEQSDLPVWTGEMYLELHRGTLTSQVRTKQGNRRSEALLHEAELWAATATVRTGEPYPQQRLNEIWRRVLLLQFHDILPGSSIAWVHREAEAEYERVAAELEGIIARALSLLTGHGDRELLANAAPLPIAGAPPHAVVDAPAPVGTVSLRATDEGWLLCNDRVRVELNREGLITSLRDASGRESIPPGQLAGVLRVHHDLPALWDAWDIDPEYRRVALDVDTAVDIDTVAGEDGAVVRATRHFGRSRVTQSISLSPGGDAVDIQLDIDWQERNRLLKVVFPFDVKADRSTSEIQFGHLDRPTHTNTSWDEARFEFVAHRWLHVGETGFGVAVANDSSYGHAVERMLVDDRVVTVVSVSVLRSPVFPDPDADRGAHRMRFAVRPGAGLADAATEGHRLNGGTRRVRGAHGAEPLVRSSNPDIRVETVKLAEDGSGDLVVRLVEEAGGLSSARIRVDAPIEDVCTVDLLERPLTASGARGLITPVSDPTDVAVRLGPFQILTLRYRRG